MGLLTPTSPVYAGTSVSCPHTRSLSSLPVELIFTSLLVIMAVAVLWFAGYVIYRLYSDQR